MNRALVLFWLFISSLLSTAIGFAADIKYDISKYNFDNMQVESKVINFKAPKQVIEAPYTVNPSSGNHFICIRDTLALHNHGYLANDRIGWYYWVNATDSVLIDFDFNLHHALDDSIKVVICLRPDEEGNMLYALEYRLNYPGSNTGNTWVNLATALDGKSLHFVPNPDSVTKYGPITLVFFRFDSNGIRNGVDGFGFGVGLDNIVIEQYSNGVRTNMVDDFENEAEYSKQYPINVGYPVDFWLDPDDSPDKWTWVRNFYYLPATAAKPSNWLELKREY